jgi:WD40 repeat protein
MESGTQIGDDWRDKGDDEPVLTIALSPNSKRVASGSKDGTVKLWDVETGKVIARWTEHRACVASVCWSPIDERVLSGSWDGTARVWNVESGETILGPIQTEQEYVFVVAYSPDGSKFATGGYNSALKIWDSSTGKFFQTLGEDDDAVVCLTWTSDGKKLIFWSSSSIRIFDTDAWQEVAVLEGHKTAISAITLSRNDRLLASTSWSDHDQTHLWNLDTNLQISLPFHHEKEVYCAAFSADGMHLVTGCDNTNAYIWDLGTILKEHQLEHLLPTSDVSVK